MDITCAKCQEPWDAFGIDHGDMSYEERARFLAGEGCPACRFGERLPMPQPGDPLEIQFAHLHSALDATDDPEAVLGRLGL